MSIRMFKGDQSMLANDNPRGLDLLKGCGWVTEAPEGWTEPEDIEDDFEAAKLRIESLEGELKSQVESNVELEAQVTQLTDEKTALEDALKAIQEPQENTG